jgi:hypothetical protein
VKLRHAERPAIERVVPEVLDPRSNQDVRVRRPLAGSPEGWFQYYLHPDHAGAGGLKLTLRLHGLGFGRFVPYFEVTGGAGGTGLNTPESRSTFTFVIEAGPGFSIMLSRDLAIYAGYRVQHFSNGNTSRPNRGYESQSGLVGVSFFFH